MIEALGSADSYELYQGSGLLPIYFAIEIILFLYVFYKQGFNKWTIYLVLLFIPNIFQFIGFKGLYKIILTLYTLFIFFNTKSYIICRNYLFLDLLFLVWTIWFCISCVINDVPVLMMLSQYGVKSLFVFLWFYISVRISHSLRISEILYKVIKYALVIQPVLAIVKYLLWGIIGEGLVGSLTTYGGGPNNIIPIVGFLLVWIHNKGKLSLNDWLYCLFLLVSPVIGGKRSIWFFYPTVVGAILLFSAKIKNAQTVSKHLVAFIVILPLVVYLGVRLNPTLNPDEKVWGRFDYNYVIDYSSTYLFGDSSDSSGRGGSFLSLLNNSNSLNPRSSVFGSGIDVMKKSYDEFDNSGLDVKMKGEIGAFAGNCIAYGVVGALLLMLFQIAVIFEYNSKAISVILILFSIIEAVIFYNVLMEGAMVVVLLFSMHSFRRHHIVNYESKGLNNG